MTVEQVDENFSIDVKLSEKIKDAFKNWASNSTCHGLPKISRSKNKFLRIIWILCFGICAGFCCYQVLTTFRRYLDYPVYTIVKLNHESPTFFPAVTFCNLNPFNMKRAQVFVDSVLAKYNISVDQLGNSTAIEHATLILEKLKIESKYRGFNSSELKQLGFTLEEMLISCSYNGNLCENNDFYWFWNFNYGSCYTFNQGFTEFNNNSTYKPIKIVTDSGINHGLQMEIYVGNIETLQYSYQTGMTLMIHNQSILPDFESGIFLSPGFETNILVDRTFTYKLDYPFSNCIKNVNGRAASISPLYNGISKNLYYGEYNRKDCLTLCYQNYVEKNCKCSAASVFRLNRSLGICYNEDQIKCQNREMKLFYRSSVYELCSDYCPEECDSVDYAAVTSIAIYPSAWYSTLLQKQKSFNRFFDNLTTNTVIRDSALKVNVFYDDLVYMISTEQQAVKVNQQLAEIGGEIGLFIGISFLSLIEFLDLAYELLFILFTHFKSKTVNPQNSQNKF